MAITKKATAKEEKLYNLDSVKIDTYTFDIEGKGVLCLNQMNARNNRMLKAKQSGQPGDDRDKVPNPWEDSITSLHWLHGHGMKDSYAESTEEKFEELLKDKSNPVCIPATAFKKSWNQAVVNSSAATYSTDFDFCVNIVAQNNLVPIRFTEHWIEEKMMTPKVGSPVLTRLNRFSGWSATLTIEIIVTGLWSPEQVLKIVELAGAGKGIGSGRKSQFGRYKLSRNK